MSFEDDIEAWIAAGRKAMADAIASVPSHDELLAAGEALLRHLVTAKPGDVPAAAEAPEPFNMNVASSPEMPLAAPEAATAQEGISAQTGPGAPAATGADPYMAAAAGLPPPPPPEEHPTAAPQENPQ